MNKVIDINAEDYKIQEKISVNIENFNNVNLSVLKCFKSLSSVIILKAKRLNIIKIQKTIFLNLSNLQFLDLRENKLLKITKNLQYLKNLKSIKLDHNSIKYLPNSIGSLEKLEILTISNNNLKYMPHSIQYLHKLKTLKISNNQINTLPIEFGLLKSLECLHIDANYFTEIPTTLCYLKHLSELSFEWLEFLETPFQKLIKESLGKTIITLFRNSLQEMIKQNILYCDFITFLNKNSNENNTKDLPTKNSNDPDFTTFPEKFNLKDSEKTLTDENMTRYDGNIKKMVKIFYAIENNYYGVIKSLITSNEGYLNLKNSDNKTPLYYSIHIGRLKITNLILTNINFSKIPNPHIYLHKAIRMRDPILTEKLIEMGINPNSVDDQGASCFHVLFSTFIKNFYKCSLIGDILIRHSCALNSLNIENWAPIHIASRRSVKECINWIINQNKFLQSLGKETFDLNIKGKNKWTPLHLAVNGFRLDETLILLDNGSDVLAKTSDGKIPRHVANGNYLFTKLLRNYELNYYQMKFPSCHKNLSTNNNCFTTVEDISNYIDRSSLVVNERRESMPLHIVDLNINTVIDGNNISNNLSNSKSISKIHSKANSKPNSKSNSLSNNFLKNLPNSISSNNINSCMHNNIKSLNILTGFTGKVSKNYSQLHEKKILNSKKNSGNSNKIIGNQSDKNNVDGSPDKKSLNRLSIDSITSLKEYSFPEQIWKNPKFNTSMNEFKKSTGKINSIPAGKSKTTQINKLENKSSNIMVSNLQINNIHPLLKTVKVNLHFHKEILMSNENSLAEKYESLMQIKIVCLVQKNSPEVENIIKSIIETIDIDKETNKVIFSDICNIIIINQYITMISQLENIQRNLGINKNNNSFIEKELINTILILKSLNSSSIKINIDDKSDNSASFRKVRKNSNSKIDVHMKLNPNIKQPKHKNKQILKEINAISTKLKRIMNYGKTIDSNNIPTDKNDEFNYLEMNEISQSFIDMNSYNKPITRKLRDMDNRKYNDDTFNFTPNDESCNVNDSSWSVVKFEVNDAKQDQQHIIHSNKYFSTKVEEVKCDTIRPDEDEFIINSPKNISAGLFNS